MFFRGNEIDLLGCNGSLFNHSRIDDKFKSCYGGDAEQGIQLEEDLAAHFMKLSLPGLVGDRDDKSFAFEADGGGSLAQLLADGADPGGEDGLLSRFFRIAGFSQENRKKL